MGDPKQRPKDVIPGTRNCLWIKKRGQQLTGTKANCGRCPVTRGKLVRNHRETTESANSRGVEDTNDRESLQGKTARKGTGVKNTGEKSTTRGCQQVRKRGRSREGG